MSSNFRIPKSDVAKLITVDQTPGNPAMTKVAINTSVLPSTRGLTTLLEHTPSPEAGRPLDGAVLLAAKTQPLPQSLMVKGLSEALEADTLKALIDNKESAYEKKSFLGRMFSTKVSGSTIDKCITAFKKSMANADLLKGEQPWSACEKAISDIDRCIADLEKSLKGLGKSDKDVQTLRIALREQRDMIRTISKALRIVDFSMDDIPELGVTFGVGKNTAGNTYSLSGLYHVGLVRKKEFKAVGKAFDNVRAAQQNVSDLQQKANNYLSMSVKERTASLKGMIGSLSTLDKEIDKALSSLPGKDSGPATILKELRASVKAKIGDYSAIANDELRSFSTVTEALRRGSDLGHLASDKKVEELVQQKIHNQDDHEYTYDLAVECRDRLQKIIDGDLASFCNRLESTTPVERARKLGELERSLNDLVTYALNQSSYTAMASPVETMVNAILEPVRQLRLSSQAETKMGAIAVTTLAFLRQADIPADAMLAMLQSGVGPEAFTVSEKMTDSQVRTRYTLGSGALNTVTLVKYDNGEERVLKPDLLAGVGLSDMDIPSVKLSGMNDGYGAAGRNLASGSVAGSLGLSSMLPRPDLLMHNGVLMIAMPKAEGKSVEAMTISGTMPDATDVTLMTNIARETNKLEWLDAITGQVDRHGGNYFLNFGKDKSVSVVGIDNDLCFGALHGNVDELGGKPVAESGSHSIGYPAVIDSGVYKALKGKSLTDLLGTDANYLSPDAKDAARKRLDDLQNHAENLNKKGLVIDNWQTWTLKNELAPTLNPQKDWVSFGTKGATILEYLSQCGTPTYFSRDFT